MRRLVIVLGLLGGTIGAVAWWRRHSRIGAEYVNRVIDPWLVGRGIVEKSEGELGLVEHVGRVSGIIRVTPVHPVATADGYRIVVPLGAASQWAQNVVAAGRCRVQVGGVVHELDEPRLVSPIKVAGIPPIVAHFMDWLGFRYMLLHQFAEHEGTLAAQTSSSGPDVTGAVSPGAVEVVVVGA
jgi:deazaflavin-dependent oxidoreductase (nitroreductase family)